MKNQISVSDWDSWPPLTHIWWKQTARHNRTLSAFPLWQNQRMITAEMSQKSVKLSKFLSVFPQTDIQREPHTQCKPQTHNALFCKHAYTCRAFTQYHMCYTVSYAFTGSCFWINATGCPRLISWHGWNTCRSPEWLETASAVTTAECGPELSRHCCCCCCCLQITLGYCFPSSSQHVCFPRGTPRAVFKKSCGTLRWEQGKHIEERL